MNTKKKVLIVGWDYSESDGPETKPNIAKILGNKFEVIHVNDYIGAIDAIAKASLVNKPISIIVFSYSALYSDTKLCKFILQYAEPRGSMSKIVSSIGLLFNYDDIPIGDILCDVFMRCRDWRMICKQIKLLA